MKEHANALSKVAVDAAIEVHRESGLGLNDFHHKGTKDTKFFKKAFFSFVLFVSLW